MYFTRFNYITVNNYITSLVILLLRYVYWQSSDRGHEPVRSSSSHEHAHTRLHSYIVLLTLCYNCQYLTALHCTTHHWKHACIHHRAVALVLLYLNVFFSCIQIFIVIHCYIMDFTWRYVHISCLTCCVHTNIICVCRRSNFTIQFNWRSKDSHSQYLLGFLLGQKVLVDAAR